MSKLKSHSGTKKRFRSTGRGKVSAGQAGKRHGMRKRSSDMKRTARGTAPVHAADAKNILRYRAPYGLR